MNNNENFVNAFNNLKNGVLYLLDLNNLSLLIKNLDFIQYERLISSLQDIFTQDSKCYAVHNDFQHFWIISKFEIRDYLEKEIHKYILVHKIYLSMGIISTKFRMNDNLHKLQYRLLSNSIPEKDNFEEQKIYQLYEDINCSKLFLKTQPIVDHDQNIYCYECLLRGCGELFSSTSDMIEVAERGMLVNLLDDYVLDLIVSRVSKDKNILLSMNVSCSSVHDSDWTDSFIKIMECSKLASNIIVEITETTLKRNYTKISHFIDDIRKIGVKVALDDFGTGYTSFLQLKSFNVDFIKIDGLFVRNILYDNVSSVFVRSVVEIAHKLGIKVIAECVEDESVANLLKQWGVDYLQGFYFGKPTKIDF